MTVTQKLEKMIERRLGWENVSVEKRPNPHAENEFQYAVTAANGYFCEKFLGSTFNESKATINDLEVLYQPAE